MIELNKENVAEALLVAVKKRGADYRYQSEFGKLCLYVVGKEPERKPGCIVGEVLHPGLVDIRPTHNGAHQAKARHNRWHERTST